MREMIARWRAMAGAASVTPDHSHAASFLLSTAEAALAREGDSVPAADWHAYLQVTARPSFLEALPDAASRTRWAETTFVAIRRSGYSLATLFQQRVAEHPDRVLFDDSRDSDTPTWTYAQVGRYTRLLAASFIEPYDLEPRVAILADNTLDTACVDLACLLHGIFVSPLNVHTDADTLVWMFDRLGITVAVTDTDERLARLEAVQLRTRRPFRLLRSGDPSAWSRGGATRVDALRQVFTRIQPARAEAVLASRGVDLTAPATVLFTSGSTGQPKGVVFSHYSLVAKRFARGAALPAVGRDEVFLCYLPLFHTFGRFLEMLGAVYWGATYVFAGSPSADVLMAELSRVRPTGLISIPARWAQIRERCLDEIATDSDRAVDRSVFRAVVGDRLRWGLSAAGFLEPTVFRFFQRHGVDLCSGFGMTEATGGITMTPPGAYVDGTVGIPLPGMRIRLSEQGELQMAGPYVARYLDEEGEGAGPAIDPDADHWVATGDLFVQHPDGYLEIVDRIKDIYKNSRGQTIAPQRVEQRLASVPGVVRCFLAGDHRDHNVLLIVPDRGDPVLAGRSDDQVHEYLAHIVASVNQGLAPYERVVQFAVLPRDFETDRDELTTKGSLRRKVIEAHFADVIDGLYRSHHVEFDVEGIHVRIPRWFFRDLAVLEDDIIARPGRLMNRRSGQVLRLGHGRQGRIRVGDLEYQVTGETIDLGVFARQPRLWIGNDPLVAFAPCKPGWDAAMGTVSGHVRIPTGRPRQRSAVTATRPDPGGRLREVHDWCVSALNDAPAVASTAIGQLASELPHADSRLAAVIRRRLEALADCRDARLRAHAYRVLLLDDHASDDSQVFPAFVESGRSFLDDESIEIVAAARHGERRLQALRERLYRYRTGLTWPGPRARRTQFAAIFRLLARFARDHADFFPPVQAELACWALFEGDPLLARRASRELADLNQRYDADLRARVPVVPAIGGRLVFEEGIPEVGREVVTTILRDPTFLVRSIAHACGEVRFEWERVVPGGVWVSPVLSHHPTQLYRLGINLVDGRHFNLLLVTGPTVRTARVAETVLWMRALSCHAPDTSVLPRFGAWRRDLGAIAVAYVSELTAWERIRELASQHDVRDGIARTWAWKKLFVRAMAAYFRGWQQSGYRIVPGVVSPANVALPDADFHETASILSLAGWRPYTTPLALVDQLVRGFYRLSESLYPQCREILDLGWILDACRDGLRDGAATRFIDDLDSALAEGPDGPTHEALRAMLDTHRRRSGDYPPVPLPVACAIERYKDWERSNPGASPDAREEAIIQMRHLYRLDRFPDVYRYLLFQRTYFAGGAAPLQERFERLIVRSAAGPVSRHDSLDALSEIQGLLHDEADRDVFSRMVFPHARRTHTMELTSVGRRDDKRVIVRSALIDDSGGRYVVREPIAPVEVGHLYRLLLDTDYPKHIGADDEHLVVTDIEERVVGGLCYRWRESRVVYVDGIVVAAPQTNLGIGGRLVDDFCVRMAAQGARCVTTNFFLGRLFSKHGFQVNQRWGGLVRFLEGDGEAGA